MKNISGCFRVLGSSGCYYSRGIYSFKCKEVRDFFFHKSFQVAPASALGYAGRLGRTGDAPDASGVLIRAHNLKTNETITHSPISSNAEVTPQKTITEKFFETTGKLDKIQQSYTGDEGFKNAGEDLSKTSTLVKATGIVLTVIGLPEVGIPIYEAGSVIDNAADVMTITSEINEGNSNDAIMTGVKIGLGFGAGRYIDNSGGADNVRDFAKKSCNRSIHRQNS